MTAPVANKPGGAAIDTKAIAVITAYGEGISIRCKVFSEFIPDGETFGLNRTAIGGIGDLVHVTEFLVEIHKAGRTFVHIAHIVGEIIIVIDISYPGVIGAIGGLVTLGSGALCRQPAKKDQADN